MESPGSPAQGANGGTGNSGGVQVADSQGTVLNDASNPSGPLTNDEKLLARITYSEGADQPFDAKVGVASVVQNRVESGAFPNSYEGVINQRNQFQPVGSGGLWSQFDAANNYVGSNVAAYRDSLYAARQVYLGTIRDVSGGALYFHSYPQLNPGFGWYSSAIAAGRIQPTLPSRIGAFWFFR